MIRGIDISDLRHLTATQGHNWGQILFFSWLSFTLRLLVATGERNEQAFCPNRDTTPPTTRLYRRLPRMQ